MYGYSEDNLKALHKITDEVFVVSNKPQLSLIQKMKQIPCDIMATGIHKVPMDYFFCKTCDKEHKYPICKVCAEQCHKNHLILDYVSASEEHLSICMCGFKGHAIKIKKKEEEIIDIDQNSSKCYFNDLSMAAGLYEYYISQKGKKICIFCYHFCCHYLNTNDDDEESRLKAFQKYKFKKVSLNQKEFLKGIEEGQIFCDCYALNDSRHKISDYLYLFLNNLNQPYFNEYDDDNYFSDLSPTKLINLFFNCIELFESIYTNFFREYNEFLENLNLKNDRIQIGPFLSNGYTNFSSNSNNCLENFYFNEKINMYFTTNLAKTILEKNLQINEQNNKFVIDYLRGYIKFRLGSYMEQMQRYLITDIFNLTPFQRYIWFKKCQYIFYTNGLKKSNLIKAILNSIIKIIRQRPDLEDSIDIIIELLRIIKFYARFYFLVKEEIIEVCRTFEDFFGYLSDFLSSEEYDDIPIKNKKIKLFKTIIKIITYFSIYINDDVFFSFFDLKNEFEEEDNEPNFYHSFTEASKLSNKILIMISNAVMKEYEVSTFLIQNRDNNKNRRLNKRRKSEINFEPLIDDSDVKRIIVKKDEENQLTYEQYQICLTRIIDLIQFNLDFNLQNNDVYLNGILRCINKNLPLFYDLITDNEKEEFLIFGKNCIDIVENLESYYYDFFNSSHITFDIIQDYIISSTNMLLSKFSYNLDNLMDNQGQSYFCDYKNIYPKYDQKKENEMSYEFMLNKAPNLLYSITKVFTLIKDKSSYSEQLITNIFKLCFAFISDNPDNCIIGISTPILKNLIKVPKPYLCCIIDYMTYALQILSNNNSELNIGFHIARFGMQIFDSSSKQDSSKKNKTNHINYHCLIKLFNLLQMLFTFKLGDQNHYVNFIKPCLETFLEHDIIKNYKNYLLKIAEDYKRNKKDYTSRKTFDNQNFFDKQFENYIKGSNSLNSNLAFQIFFGLMKLVTKTFDVNALEDIPDILKNFLLPEDIFKILSIISLDIPLRIELIKFYRMIYIDISIDKSKIEKYRFKFHEELDTEVEEITDGLISADSMKIFIFLQRLIKVSNYDFDSKSSKMEYDLLFFEIKNFRKIIINSRTYDKKIYMSFIENGIILPVKIYLNKVLSMMMSISGEGLLKLYRLCYYILIMKEYIIESNLISDLSEEDKIDSVFKGNDLKGESALHEVKVDIATITNANFSVLNYREIYLYINKHVMSLIEEPTSVELLIYLSEYQKYEKKEKTNFKKKLKKNGISLDKFPFNKAWEIFEIYIQQKNNFDKSSIKANFDDNIINGEITYRTILLKYLMFLSTNKADCFEEEGINMLLKLLQNEPDESQIALFYQKEKNEDNKEINLKSSEIKNQNNDIKIRASFKKKQAEEIYYMAKNCFDNLLSCIFNQYNPTSLELSDEYYKTCHIIQIFKYLCEAHNQNFQGRLMNEITFDIGQNNKLNFYDMMLFVLDKIIIISSWEQLKADDDVQDYFYALFTCLVELLIEIIRGSDANNFKNFFEEEKKEGGLEIKKEQESNPLLNNKNENNSENYKYEKGKALKVFLHNIRKIMFENTSQSEILFSVRKNLMDFILSFMEEVNCPSKIKSLIMSYYSPSMIIKSICTALKIYYFKHDLKTNSKIFDELNQEKNKNTLQRIRTNQIIENNLANSRIQDKKIKGGFRRSIDHEENIYNEQDMKKPLNKMLKQIKFDEELCDKFLKLYFEDGSFSKSKIFALCNAYFKYFQLIYIQFRNEEAIDFWNRVHNQSPEALAQYNRRNKLNKNGINSSYFNDENIFEAYYVIKLFKEISKYVLVKISPEIPPIYIIYTIHPYSKYLSSDSKSEFLRNVDRKNRYSKLYDLIESSEYFRLEIIYNFNYLRTNKLFRMSTEINYRIIGYISFLVALCLNFVLFSTLHNNGQDSYGGGITVNIIDFISYGFSIIFALIVLFWFLTKYQLYYEIEKAKYLQHHYNKSNYGINNLTFRDYLSINYETIMGKGELDPLFYFIFFILLGSFYDQLRFLFSFSLLSILSLNQSLKNIALSFFTKGNFLMWTSLFTLVLLYEYSGWGFFFQRDRFYETSGRDKPEEMCKSLLYCFLTMINNGMRWHCGIGKITRSESYILHFWPFVHRFCFDLLFFWLIEVVMLKILYGIILDSFSELRQTHNLIEKDMTNNCFICNLDKDECEKNNINFQEHCEKVHNVWDYAFYMITLRMNDTTNLNAINLRNKQKILEKSVDWLPDSSLDRIEDNHLKVE